MVDEFTRPTDSGGDLDLEAEERLRLAMEEDASRRESMEAWRRERDGVSIQGNESIVGPGIPPGRATAAEAKVLPGDGRRGPNPWN